MCVPMMCIFYPNLLDTHTSEWHFCLSFLVRFDGDYKERVSLSIIRIIAVLFALGIIERIQYSAINFSGLVKLRSCEFPIH